MSSQVSLNIAIYRICNTIFKEKLLLGVLHSNVKFEQVFMAIKNMNFISPYRVSPCITYS